MANSCQALQVCCQTHPVAGSADDGLRLNPAWTRTSHSRCTLRSRPPAPARRRPRPGRCSLHHRNCDLVQSREQLHELAELPDQGRRQSPCQCRQWLSWSVDLLCCPDIRSRLDICGYWLHYLSTSALYQLRMAHRHRWYHSKRYWTTPFCWRLRLASCYDMSNKATTTVLSHWIGAASAVRENYPFLADSGSKPVGDTRANQSLLNRVA